MMEDDGNKASNDAKPTWVANGGGDRFGLEMDLEAHCSMAQTEQQWTKDKLPPPRENELEFFLKDPKSFKQGKSVHSPVLQLNGFFGFRLLVFPTGTDNTGKPEQIALFVEAVVPDYYQGDKWSFEQVKFNICLVNWKDYSKTVVQGDTFNFQSCASTDRGWHKNFLKVSEMTEENGWLNAQGELCIRSACSVRRAMVLHTNSRRSIGFIGLKNHGATCYMNCLLQTLFHIGHFRDIVYSIDLPETSDQQATTPAEDAIESSQGDDRPEQPLLVALQNLFYRLQTSEVPVSCRELMRSFGWGTADAFMQHDAQELNRVLCDRLEEQMKNTPMDGAIKSLFEGEMENFIECLDVNYRSTRTETFYDLQLNVRNEAGKDLVSLEESLREFTNEEILEGDNAYDAGVHGKQRAKKGCRFKKFPPVLYIQLKRFMFDAERMDMCKLNSKMSFPLYLDLEEHAPGSGKYMLHSVVVHTGGVSSGHYYAYVRNMDGEKSQWVKLDDEQVTFCSEQAAIEDNYGGEDPAVEDYFKIPANELRNKEIPKFSRFHSAYMLSYVSVDRMKDILAAPVLSNEGKYQPLIERCEQEDRLAEERRKAKVEQMSKVEVRFVLEKDLMKMEGFWQHNELPCSKKVRMCRDDVGEELWTVVEEWTGVPKSYIALFNLNARKTKQLRFQSLPANDHLRMLIQATSSSYSANVVDPYIVVLVVVSLGVSFKLEPLPMLPERDVQVETPHDLKDWAQDLCMLIVKYFCPSKQKLVTLGCYYGLSDVPVKVMLTDGWLQSRLQLFVEMQQVAAMPEGTALLCFEEFSFKHPKDIIIRDVENSIKAEGLYPGDILIWQPEPHRPFSKHTAPGDVTEEDCNATGDFPVLTAKDLCARAFNICSIVARLSSAEAPWCPDFIGADGNWTFVLGEDPELRAKRQEAGEGTDLTFPGEVKSCEMEADWRWTLEMFVLKAVKALGIEDALEGGQPIWLFDRGPPSACSDPPAYRSEVPLEHNCRRLRDLFQVMAQTAKTLGTLRMSAHLVLLPRIPVLDLSVRRVPGPVVLHFFDNAVREVGACVIQVSPVEEDSNDAMQDDMPLLLLSSGRPALDPAEVLELARRHLALPEQAALRQKIFPKLGANEDLPLRLIDVSDSRIRAVHRSSFERTNGELPATRFWPAVGQNVFFSALRVEPDCDDEDAQADAGPSSERQADADDIQNAQLVEVFHSDRDRTFPLPFGHPFLMRMVDGERAISSMPKRLQAKLGVAEREAQSWKLLRVDGSPSRNNRTPVATMVDELDAWEVPRHALLAHGANWLPTGDAFCLERRHPLTYRGLSPAQSTVRQQKALTIRARPAS